MIIQRFAPKFSALSVALFACLALNVVSQSAKANPPKYNYWIEQLAQAGPHKIHLTEQGFTVECVKLGFCVQYKEADKMVTGWSLKDHTYYVLPFESWMKNFRNLFAAVSWYAEMVKPTGISTETRDKFAAHTYHYRVNAQSPSYWSSDIGRREKPQGLQDVDYTTIDLPSKPACLMMQKIYDTPRVPGFPFAIFRKTLQTTSLKTSRLISNFNQPISFFVPTAEFKKVPFSNQVIGPSFDENMTKMMLPY